MSVKYFEYNTNPNGEKYMEVTMEEFQRDVMETKGRYYISFGTSVLECSYEVYKKMIKKRIILTISAKMQVERNLWLFPLSNTDLKKVRI